ncbi:MAG: flippase-like domain-containing protein [Chloroflexota bacterium]|nr:flippase-like domain-containing protein [Chloroflexota bacterium]
MTVAQNRILSRRVVRSPEPDGAPRRSGAFSLKFWIGIAISVVFLYLALRGQDFGALWRAMREASYVWLIPAIGCYFVGVVIRTYRWHILLRSTANIPMRRLWPVIVIGYMANNILPLRAGELVRTYVLSEREKVSRSATLATIVVERVFDGLTMLAFIVFAALFIDINARVRQLVIVAALLFLGGLAVFFFLAFAGAWRVRILRPIFARLPHAITVRIEALIIEFVAGLGSLRRAGDSGLVAVSSVAAWGMEATMYALVARGFGLALNPAGAMLTTGVANLFTLVPSSPGYIGPFEAGTLLVIQQILKLPVETTGAFALVLHAALYFPITVWGMYYWFSQHLSLRTVQQMEQRAVSDEQ